MADPIINDRNPNQVKVTLVGERNIGKSALITKFLRPTQAIKPRDPTIRPERGFILKPIHRQFDNHPEFGSAHLIITEAPARETTFKRSDGTAFIIEGVGDDDVFHAIKGQESPDCIMICFDLSNPDSIANAQYWLNTLLVIYGVYELSDYNDDGEPQAFVVKDANADIPQFVLAGTMSDCQHPDIENKLRAFREKIRHLEIPYIATSSVENKGVTEAFLAATKPREVEHVAELVGEENLIDFTTLDTRDTRPAQQAFDELINNNLNDCLHSPPPAAPRPLEMHMDEQDPAPAPVVTPIPVDEKAAAIEKVRKAAILEVRAYITDLEKRKEEKSWFGGYTRTEKLAAAHALINLIDSNGTIDQRAVGKNSGCLLQKNSDLGKLYKKLLKTPNAIPNVKNASAKVSTVHLSR